MNLEDIAIIEGETNADQRTTYEAVQRAINGGKAWKFQGNLGRTLMAAIEAGYCLLGQHATTDFYGSHIPSRSKLQQDQGSRDTSHTKVRWAAQMEAIVAGRSVPRCRYKPFMCLSKTP